MGDLVSSQFRAPRGTFDLVPPRGEAVLAVREAMAAPLRLAGYGYLETPAFEETALFVRGVGESTDVVSKEMYSFTTRGGDDVTLRPEGTAPVLRATLEHNLHRGALPLKLWYSGSYYRYERPQRGRYRHFSQVGAEAIGTEDPAVDAELIVLAVDAYRTLGLTVRLLLNSLGSDESRPVYRAALQSYLRTLDLDDETRRRVELNPLRVLDDRRPEMRTVLTEAPVIADFLSAGDREHPDAVRVRPRRVGRTVRGGRRGKIRRTVRGPRRTAAAGCRLGARCRAHPAGDGGRGGGPSGRPDGRRLRSAARRRGGPPIVRRRHRASPGRGRCRHLDRWPRPQGCDEGRGPQRCDLCGRRRRAGARRRDRPAEGPAVRRPAAGRTGRAGDGGARAAAGGSRASLNLAPASNTCSNRPMRWQGQRIGAEDETALPGLKRIPGLVRSVTTPEFAGVTFHEVNARSVLNQVPSRSMVPFRWTVNPYRGCTHACRYCLSGDTLILMATGRVRRLADVREGDRVY